MPPVRNLVGERFGRLLVTGPFERVQYGAQKKTMWECLCDCGNVTKVAVGNLQSGSVKSCGCLRKEVLDKTTHGMEKHPLYLTWCHIMSRCYNKNVPHYKNYGGRGIKVCEKWQDVRNFIADMGPKPTDDMSIERIDVNGDYEPGNCRWATSDEQANNKRNSRKLTFDGRTLTMSQWAKELQMPVETLFSRLKKLSVDEALTRPQLGRSRKGRQVALSQI